MQFLTIERNVGPPSEPVNINSFAEDTSTIITRNAPAQGTTQKQSHKEILAGLPLETVESIKGICKVDDIRTSLTKTWNAPRVSVYLQKEQEDELRAMSAVPTTSRKKSQPGPFIKNDAPEIIQLKADLAQASLKTNKLQAGADLFARNSSFMDTNAINVLKFTEDGDSTSLDGETPTAVITISVQSKLSNGHPIPNCQLAFLSSQSLGTVFEALPCVSNELPVEVLDGHKVTGYTDAPGESSGGLIVIDNMVYGDGMDENDYADKFLEHQRTMTKQNTHYIKAQTSMHDTRLDSLSLRIEQPYWLVHQGNCEHWVIIDEIRMLHRDDPTLGYPIGLWYPPILMDMCRVCTKRIAVWSIVGDVRLKESPCILCAACWDGLGPPKEEDVLVVPLPKHQHGW
ncbi:snRNA-activating protein of 50kDa MW C terminal-domain-containing protein [Flagelloscypha sp. PMI_526]|nr:snRNA-activating protein of 50kDa MW C terminal-domain-containing protein [Flagelloscypha sp. PMI_526]